jgi:hypothetical protein
MTPTKPVPRPRQVTLSASLVMAGSVLLVASIFERLGDLHSLETRTAIQRFLSEPPGSDLGVGLESVLSLLRTVSMVAAGLATAAAILGYHVLRRNRGARIGLGVLAIPLFLCGLVTGGFLASVVAASVAMLWLQPSRSWFLGDDPPPNDADDPASGRASGRASVRADPAPGDLPLLPPLEPPGATAAPQQAQPAWTPYASTEPWLQQRRPARPGSLVTACVVTWATCALAGLFAILMIAVLAADPGGLVAEMHRQNPALADEGITDATLKTVAWVVGLGCLAWALVSSVLAVLAFQGVRWARIALVVSAGGVAIACIGGSLVSPVLAAPGVLAAFTAVLLLRPQVQRWFSRPGPRRDVMSP